MIYQEDNILFDRNRFVIQLSFSLAILIYQEDNMLIRIVIQLEEGSNVENLQAQRCRARIDHLDSADVENITEWNNTKLKRILVDYMLRMSYFETASKLSESSNISVSLL